MRTTGGERLLKAALPDGKLPAQCKPESAADAKPVQLQADWFQADWFPKDARKARPARAGAGSRPGRARGSGSGAAPGPRRRESRRRRRIGCGCYGQRMTWPA